MIASGAPIEGRSYLLLVPDGECPAQLRGTSEDEVRSWVTSVALSDTFRSERSQEALTVEALTYWVRQFYPVGSSEHGQVCEILDRIAREGIPVRCDGRR